MIPTENAMVNQLRFPSARHFLLGLMLVISAYSFGQTDEVRLDSLYDFQFTSPTDSFPVSKNVCSFSGYENSSDCYNFSTCIFSGWDRQKRVWIPYAKHTTRLENDGDKQVYVGYLWDSKTESWQQTRRTFDLKEADLRETDDFDWDTLTQKWIHTRSFVQNFDQNGNQTLGQGKFFRQDDQIWEGYGEESVFDEDSRLIEHIDSQWKEAENSWIPERRYTQSYNGPGDIQEIVHYYWNEDGGIWTVSSKENFTYDQGLEILWENSFLYDPLNPSFRVREKTEKTYDSLGNLLIEESTRINNADEWEVFYRTEQTYNSKEEVIWKNTYFWNLQAEELLLTQTDSFVYTPTGRIAFQQQFFYDHTENVYGNRREYEFDSQDKQTLRLTWYWNQEEEDWKLSHKTESPYKPNGKREYYATYNWDVQAEKWVGENKTGFDYAENGYLLRRYKSLWSLNRDDWSIRSNSIYAYGPCKQEHFVPAKASLLLYPNPVTESVVYVESELERPVSYEVLDLQGRRVLSGEMNSIANPINVETLSNGVYMILLQSGENSESRKFVVARP